MTSRVMIEGPIDSFLDSKGGNVALTKDDLKELREMYVPREVFELTLKASTDALERYTATTEKINETLTEICTTAADREKRLLHVEDQHEHDEECHQLTEKKIDRKIEVAKKQIAIVTVCAVLFIGIIVPAARAWIVPLFTQVVK